MQRRFYAEIGQPSLERLFPSLTEDIRNRVQESARHRSSCTPGSPHCSQTARIQGMIRDAVLAGLLPERILETRLSEVIETATSTCLRALNSDEQAMAELDVQKAAQAADESWQTHFLGAARPRSRRTDH